MSAEQRRQAELASAYSRGRRGALEEHLALLDDALGPDDDGQDCADVADAIERARDALRAELREDRGDIPFPDPATAPAHIVHVLGRGDGRGPGLIDLGLDENYPTVIAHALGAVGIRTQPSGELAVYLEIAGRYNKRQERDERAYVLALGQAAELVAELTVAGMAAGTVFAREFDSAMTRKRRERGLER